MMSVGMRGAKFSLSLNDVAECIAFVKAILVLVRVAHWGGDGWA